MWIYANLNVLSVSSINFPSTFLLVLCNASKSANSSDFILWLIQKKCRLTSTTNNCCQRAKLHRWVAQPGLFAKCHDNVAFYILGTCVIFLRLHFIALLFYFIALLFYSIALLFNFSKCKQALIFILDASQRLFFILLSMKQCPIFVSKQFDISLLFFGLFWICFKCYF